jgi:hypothetical protein
MTRFILHANHFSIEIEVCGRGAGCREATEAPAGDDHLRRSVHGFSLERMRHIETTLRTLPRVASFTQKHTEQNGEDNTRHPEDAAGAEVGDMVWRASETFADQFGKNRSN